MNQALKRIDAHSTWPIVLSAGYLCVHRDPKCGDFYIKSELGSVILTAAQSNMVIQALGWKPVDPDL